MPQIAAIVLADGQPTPVNRTFAPLGIDKNGVATHENRASGIQIGYDMLTFALRRADSKSTNNKITVKLSLPTLEVTSPSTASGIQPAPTLAFSDTVFLEFVLPSRGNAQGRKNLRVLLKNALADGGVLATMIENLEAEW